MRSDAENLKVRRSFAHWLTSATLSRSGRTPSATLLRTSLSVFQFHISVISNWPTGIILLDFDAWTCTERPLHSCHQLLWITAAWDIHCLQSEVQPFSVPVSHFGDFELADWNHITGLWRLKLHWAASLLLSSPSLNYSCVRHSLLAVRSTSLLYNESAVSDQTPIVCCHTKVTD